MSGRGLFIHNNTQMKGSDAHYIFMIIKNEGGVVGTYLDQGWQTVNFHTTCCHLPLARP